MAVQFNERAVSTCEATGSQNTSSQSKKKQKAREQDKEKRKDIRRAGGSVVVGR
jgi:hypothetical protein